MDTQFKKGVLELCVLSLINKKDYYGYEIVQSLAQYISVNEGTIYPILRRLTNENYFSSYIKISDSGPARKYYTMTSSGKKKFKESMEEWNNFHNSVNKLLKEIGD